VINWWTCAFIIDPETHGIVIAVSIGITLLSDALGLASANAIRVLLRGTHARILFGIPTAIPIGDAIVILIALNRRTILWLSSSFT
jgi:hypothetical protein